MEETFRGPSDWTENQNAKEFVKDTKATFDSVLDRLVKVEKALSLASHDYSESVMSDLYQTIGKEIPIIIRILKGLESFE